MTTTPDQPPETPPGQDAPPDPTAPEQPDDDPFAPLHEPVPPLTPRGPGGLILRAHWVIEMGQLAARDGVS